MTDTILTTFATLPGYVQLPLAVSACLILICGGVAAAEYTHVRYVRWQRRCMTRARLDAVLSRMGLHR